MNNVRINRTTSFGAIKVRFKVAVSLSRTTCNIKPLSWLNIRFRKQKQCFYSLIILCIILGVDLASFLCSAGKTSIRRIIPPSGRIFFGDRRTLAPGPPLKKPGTVASKSWVTRYLAPLSYNSSVTSFHPSSTSSSS